MIAVFAHIRHAVERRLYGMGFALPFVRYLLSIQIIISGFALTAGILLLWYSRWPLAFGAGAAIMTFSLWRISRSAQAFVQLRFSALLGLRLFFGFSVRLFLISIVLFVLIVWLKAPLVPLLLGLTSTVASILLWGVSRLSQKTVKEA